MKLLELFTCIAIIFVVTIVIFTTNLILFFIGEKRMEKREMIKEEKKRNAKEQDFFPRPLSIYLDKTSLLFKANPKSFWIDTDTRGVVVVSFIVNPDEPVKIDGVDVKLTDVTSRASSDIALKYAYEKRNVIPGDKFKAKLLEMGIN